MRAGLKLPKLLMGQVWLYGLAVMLSIPRRTTSKNIDEISTYQTTFIHLFQADPHHSKFVSCLTLVKRLLRQNKMDSNWVIFKHKIKMFYKRLFSTEFSIYLICFAMLEEISERNQWFFEDNTGLIQFYVILLQIQWFIPENCIYICFFQEWRNTLIYLQYSREKNE